MHVQPVENSCRIASRCTNSFVEHSTTSPCGLEQSDFRSSLHRTRQEHFANDGPAIPADNLNNGHNLYCDLCLRWCFRACVYSISGRRLLLQGWNTKPLYHLQFGLFYDPALYRILDGLLPRKQFVVV